MVEESTHYPTEGKYLGEVDYNGKVKVYNIDGKPVFAFESKSRPGTILISRGHIGSGYMLRQLGIEANAGGTFFVSYHFKEKTGRETFKGYTLEQIKQAQKIGYER